MMRINRPRKIEWPKKQKYYVDNLSSEKDVAWMRKHIRGSVWKMYIASGDADYKVFSRLGEDLERAKLDLVDIDFMAGPIINIPERIRPDRDQKSREELNPVVRLAKERKINLYPSEKRQMPDYRVFEDFPAMNVLEPYEPGDKPSGSFYVYNSWVEAAPWISRFREKTDQKKPVTDNFQDYFIFLSDKEIGELKKWSYEKGKDVNNIDLSSCKEFWRDYTR